jgi:hypothetical protein
MKQSFPNITIAGFRGQNVFIIIIITILLLNLFSCAPAYIPNAFNAPLIKSKNEVNISGYGGTSGLDAQVSASVIKHVAVMADYSYTNRKNTGKDSSGFRNHNFFEGGVGYYMAPENKKTSLEVWGGFGTGSSAAKAASSGLYTSKGDIVSGYYSRYFLQVDYGYRAKIIETGFAVRGSYVNFSNYTNSSTNMTYRGLDDVYIEPMGFVRVGAEFIKFSFQVGGSIRPSFFNDAKPKFTTQPFYFTCGVHVTLNRKWEDKK